MAFSTARLKQALTLAGLDPYAGFLHADRQANRSCSRLHRRFRQTIVDRTIIGLVNKRVALEQDDQHRLSEETRKKIVEKIRERLDSSEVYEKKRQALRFIIQSSSSSCTLLTQ